MKPEDAARLIKEEIELLRKQGATDVDIEEPAFMELVYRRAAERSVEQSVDPMGDLEESLKTILEKASPEQLRELAVRVREIGFTGVAYELETRADNQERQGW